MTEKNSKRFWGLHHNRVFSLFQTLVSSRRPDTYSRTICYCLNTDFHGSRTLLIFVSSLSALLTLLQWSVTWAAGRAGLPNPRENHVSWAAMTAFWQQHVTGLSWATRGSHSTGSIFPLLKRRQVQLRVLNSTVWYWLLCSALCFWQATVLHRERARWRFLLSEAPMALNTLDVFFPWAPKGIAHLPWAYKRATARQHGKAQVCLLRVAAPGSYRHREASSSLLLPKTEHWLMLAPSARLVLVSISIAKSKCSVHFIYTSWPSAGNFIIKCWQRSASQCKIYWHLSNYEMYPFHSLMALTGPGKRYLTRLSN